MKIVLLVASIATACSVPGFSWAQARGIYPTQVMSRVCIPYAGRSATFERAIAHAEALGFRLPLNALPLEEYASEVELVSREGWRVKLSEGTETQDDQDVYVVTCTLSSVRASAQDLKASIDQALSRNPRWTRGDTVLWERLYSDNTRIVIDLVEDAGEQPKLTTTAIYR